MFNSMSPGAKGLLLVVGAYVVTVAIAFLIMALAIMILLEPHSCSAMARALVVLWALIAAVFLASVIVVRVVVGKFIPDAGGRLALVVVYGVAMLATYMIIAFGLMVAFNC